MPPGFLWLGEGGLERLIPDSEMRARVEAELPELPMRLFDEGLPAPAGWCEWQCDYLLLSEEMRGEAEQACLLGWPVLEDLGNHLDVVNRPAEVAADLVRIGD